MLRSATIMIMVTAVLALVIEAVSWLVVGGAPVDPRYACAAAIREDQFSIFSYGGSTVFGTPVPEYGFMAQISAAVERLDPDRFVVCNMGEGGRDSSGVLLDIERTLRFRPDVIIAMSGHNEFLQPVFETTFSRRWRERVRDFASVRLFSKVMAKVQRRMPQRQVQQAMPDEQHAQDRTSNDFKARIARYQANMDAIVSAAGEAGVPLVLATMASNLDEWAPVYQRLPVDEGGVRDPEAVSRVLALLLAGEHDAAVSAFAALAPDEAETASPVVAYLRAQFMPYDDESSAEVRKSELVLARDLDPIPWRALSSFNDHVRRAAQDRDGVVLVDVETLLGEAAGDGLPGFSLIADNCHPTPEANRLIAAALLEAAGGFADVEFRWTESDHAAYMRSLPDSLRLDYLLRNGTYVMKVPFFNYAASRRYLEEARSGWPGDWRSWGNLASIELLAGNAAAGRTLLVEALRLQPDVALYRGHQHTPYLTTALEQHALTLEGLLSGAAPGS